jgi:hypothetical protein
MDKVNRKNSRAVLMLNKYKNINTEAKMELKLKLCFKNDLIRFIGNKLDKISKLFLVCMRYFILIEILFVEENHIFSNINQ